MRNGFVGVATPYYVEKGIPYLQSNNIRRNKIDKTQMVYINKEFHEKHEKSMLKENDILVVQSGHAGECTVVPKEFEGCNCHALIIMSPKDITSINSTFCAYYLNSPVGIKKLFPLITGNTIKHILASEMKKLRINLPSLNEQNKLSHFLSIIDKKIDLLENKLQAYMDFKKYLMQQIFAQKLRFADFTDKWIDCKFKDLGTVKSGVGFSTKYQGHLDLEYNLYKVSDMNLKGNERIMVKSNNTIDDSILKEMNAKLITEPSIIFAKVGEAIFLNRKRIANKPFLIDNNMMAFTPNNKVNIDFMYYLSTTINFGKYAQTGALPSYNASDINTIKCKIPSKEEQEKITAILSLADAKIDFYSNQLDKTKEFKKGLLQQMFV